MQFVTLTPDQVRKAQEDSHELWSGGHSLDERLCHLQTALDRTDQVLTYVGLVDETDRLVTSAKLYHTQVIIRGQELPSLGIGAVFTAPAWRGNGLARRLIANCEEWARTQGWQWSYLWSDIGTKYYESMGYQAFPPARVAYDLPATTIDSGRTTIRNAQPSDLPWLRSLYLQRLRNCDVATIRTLASWSFWRILNDTTDQIVCQDNQPIGYFAGCAASGYYWMEECYALPDRKDDFWNAVAAHLLNCGMSKVRSFRQDQFDMPMGTDDPPKDKPVPMIKCLAPSATPFDLPAKVHFNGADHF